MSFIDTFGCVSIAVLVISFLFDWKIKCKESLLFYAVIGLIIAWLIVGWGYWAMLMN